MAIFYKFSHNLWEIGLLSSSNWFREEIIKVLELEISKLYLWLLNRSKEKEEISDLVDFCS
jgi:hypothetical protein